jgi:ABC-type multidrug transport system fused ATPase/permease subunit
MIRLRLTERDDWKFAGALMSADPGLATAWWTVLTLRGVLPAVFSIATGTLVAALQQGGSTGASLAVVGVVFVLLQILGPIHRALGANLGNRTAAWLYDRLTDACITPAGMGHLENPALTNDLTMARDFDLGIMGPPLAVSMDFIAGGMVELVGGIAASLVLFAYTWWAPVLLAGGWLATHYLLRESAIWKDRNTDEVRQAQRQADYHYRLAVEAPAAKELRLFGISGWVVDRFRAKRARLVELQWEATRLRERSVALSLAIVAGANVIVFWSLGHSAVVGTLPLGRLVTFASASIAVSTIAFGGLSWAVDFASAPVSAVLRLRAAMEPAGSLAPGYQAAAGMPAREIRFRDVTFGYPGAEKPVLKGFNLTIPAGSSMAIVGQNGAGKTTIAKLLCRLYDPTEGAIEADGVDLKEIEVDEWRSRVTAVFQDFIRFELSLRENVAPSGASDSDIEAALTDAGAAHLAKLDQTLARGYPGGTDLSGGQWQRIALARALCAVRAGAGVVLLDEPTAQLDVRGEAEIFQRILAATRRVTTILISHRFSTVRHADRICVIEHGAVVELGSHEELMALNGRYRAMFDSQAARFEEEEEVKLDALD